MICEKCNKQFKSEMSLSESGTMFGLCKECGKKLKFPEIPGGFFGGAMCIAFTGPFFFLSILNWKFFLAFAACVGLGTLGMWALSKTIGGYVYAANEKEHNKSNIALSFLCGVVGFFYALICIFAIMEFN